MKLSIYENIDFTKAIQKIYQSKNSPSVMFKISSFLEEVSKQEKKYTEIKNKLLTEYADKDENGNVKTVEQNGMVQVTFNDNKDNIPKFNKEFKELLDTEFSLPKIKLSWLDKAELTNAEFIAVKELIEDDTKG